MKTKLTLSTKLTSQGKTQLDHYFVSPPFKVLTLPTQDPAWQHSLNAMQMSASPGLLANDEIEIEITLAEQTALSLGTQAFTRVQAMNEGEVARQNTLIRLAPHSKLFYLPHPLVLHKMSGLIQKTRIELSENSQLIYGEIVAVGRVLNGERFAFQRFSSHLQIYQQNRPLLHDCIQWFPHQMDLTALSQMEEFSHQGSLVFFDLRKTNSEIKPLVQQIQTDIAELNSMLVGVSQLNEQGLIVRVLGHRSEQIQTLFEQLAQRLK